MGATHGTAAAGEGPCTAVRVIERGRFATSWEDAIVELRADVAQLEGEACSSTTVVIEPSPPGARVLVAADGRQAERNIATPAALPAIVLGLLAAIPTESPPASSASAAPAAAPPAHPADPDDVPPIDKPRPAAAAPPREVGFHLAPAVGARFGAPTPVGMLDLTARFELRVHDWLVFVSGRYAFVAQRVEGSPIPGWFYDEVALGLGVGRRLHLGEVALDLALVPEVVVITEEGNMPADGVGGTAEELRMQAIARAVAPVGGRLSPSLQLDAEIVPLAPTSPTLVDSALPPLPTWTVGLGAGVVWDVP